MREARPSGCSISIIVPTHRRRTMLGRLVDSLRDCLSQVPFELILVNDCPDDPLSSILSRKDLTFPVVSATTPELGPACARNLGIDLAAGDYLVFTDDDCVVTPDWLHRLVLKIEEGYDAVGGRSAAMGDSIVESYYDFMEVFRPGCRLDGSIQYLLSNNAIIRRRTLDQAGGFSTRFNRPGGEDTELCYRIRTRGGRLGYAEEALVYHDFTPSAASFIRRFYNYGVGQRIMWEIHRSGEHYMMDPAATWDQLSGLTPTPNGIEPLDPDRPLFGILTFIRTISFVAGYLGYDETTALPAIPGNGEAFTASVLDALQSAGPIAEAQKELLDRFPESARLLDSSRIEKGEWWNELSRCFDLRQIFEALKASGPAPPFAPGPPDVDEGTRRRMERELLEQFNEASAKCAVVLRDMIAAGGAPSWVRMRSLCSEAALDWRYFEKWLAWIQRDHRLLGSPPPATSAEVARLARALAPSARRSMTSIEP